MADREWCDTSHLGPVAVAYLEAHKALNADYLEICGESLTPYETYVFATALSEAWELEKILRGISPPGYVLTWFDTDDLLKDLK